MLPLADLPPPFTVTLGDRPYSGWTDMEVTRSIDRMSGSFRIDCTRKEMPAPLALETFAGDECQIEIGGQPVLKGFIDTLSTRYDDGQTRISITGRDACCDLIDCAASVDGPFEYQNVRLEKVFERILKPFGIPLTVQADTGAPFRRVAIQPGETAMELLDRLCRFRAVLPISDGLGGLLIVKPGATRSDGAVRFGQNALEGSSESNVTERFSLYVVKGQSEASAESSAEETAGAEGRATDAGVRRYRPTVLIGENQGFDMSLKQRASWESQMRRARAVKASYTIQGWYADPVNKTLWQPNTIVPVVDEILGIKRDMLIVASTFSRGERGTVTSLDLALPEAFDLPAMKDEESEDVLGDS